MSYVASSVTTPLPRPAQLELPKVGRSAEAGDFWNPLWHLFFEARHNLMGFQWVLMEFDEVKISFNGI